MTTSRKDYLLARSRGVITGAEHGLLTTRAPEAVMIDEQRRAGRVHQQHLGAQQAANALLAQHFATQSGMASSLQELERSSLRQIGALEDLGHGVSEVNRSVTEGFGQTVDAVGRVDRTLQHEGELSRAQQEALTRWTVEEMQSGFQDVRGGLDRIDGTLVGGFERVDGTVQREGQLSRAHQEALARRTVEEMQSGFQDVRGGLDRIDGTLVGGFGVVDGALRREARLSREQQEALTRWTVEQMQGGFQNVCGGLQRIDASLVEGFEALGGGLTQLDSTLQQQTGVLDARLQRVGGEIVEAIEGEHLLDRRLSAHISALVMATLKDEGNATREALQAVGRAVVAELAAQGAMERQALQRLSGRLDALSDRLDRRLGQQAELRAREHTRAALRFLREGLCEDAEQALEQACQAFAGYFPAHYLRGVARITTDDPLGSEPHFRRALAQAGACDPSAANAERVIAQLMLGRLAATRSDWSAAQRCFEAVLALEPAHLMATIELAFVIVNDPRHGATPDSRVRVLVHRDERRPGLLDGLSTAVRPLAWYGLALLLADSAPKDAVSALR